MSGERPCGWRKRPRPRNRPAGGDRNMRTPIIALGRQFGSGGLGKGPVRLPCPGHSGFKEGSRGQRGAESSAMPSRSPRSKNAPCLFFRIENRYSTFKNRCAMLNTEEGRHGPPPGMRGRAIRTVRKAHAMVPLTASTPSGIGRRRRSRSPLWKDRTSGWSAPVPWGGAI